ncbi:MAG: N-acetyltransferase [Anaerolineae bacterium]|nr:N-acetyltransferase [Anaerolineae bacterium]MDW8100385.1 N-acetyltransferase [Anaerolineae bacterium]
MGDDNGTDIVSDNVIIRPARAEDVPAMAKLINGYAAQDLMLPRSEEQLLRHLPDFVVAEAAGRIIGCAGLARLSPELAEIRSLAVAPEMQGRGVGRALVGFLLQAAREVGIVQVCALTLRPHFFEALGFQVVDRWDISPKIWQECIYCPKFHRCDEIAVLLNLEEMMPGELPSSHWDRFLQSSVPTAWRRNFATVVRK